MLTNRTELEICLWDRDASAFYALLEYSIIQSHSSNSVLLLPLLYLAGIRLSDSLPQQAAFC